MEFKISTLAIKKPSTIFLFMLLVVLIGWTSYKALPREAAPDITWPHLYVTVPFPGATPNDIEAQITNKLEQELQNVEGMEELKSRTKNGMVTVDLKFDFGYDMDKARVKVREALDKVKPDLPDDAEDWIISEFSFSDEPILIVNLSSAVGLFYLKNAAEDLKDRLMSIPGILEVTRVGGLEKEVQIRINPEKLQFYNLDFNTVSDTIAAENKTIPGGLVKVGPRELYINVPGEFESIADIRKVIITYQNNSPVYLTDLANVQFTFKDIDKRSRLNTVESVSLEVSKRKGENLVHLSDSVKKIVDEEQKKFGTKIKFSILGDQSVFVKKLVSDLENNIFTGILFVFLVLFLFMGIRNAIFVGIAIPMSMLMSFTVLRWVGITLNFIVLFSLIVSLGMLVDNAIVIVENIYRHIQSGKSRIEAAITGVSEVAGPVIASTLTTLLAFFPIIFMPGIMGEFMNFLPKTLIITLSCSLVVGLIFNPVICATLMKVSEKKETLDEAELVRKSKFLMKYSKILEWTLRHPFYTLVIMLGFWVGMFMLYFGAVNTDKHTEFFPKEEAREAVIRIVSPQGTTLEASDKVVQKIENGAMDFKIHTDSIVSNVGGSESKIRLNFPNWEKWKTLRPSEVIEKIRNLLPSFSGADIKLDQRGGGGPPVGRPINVEVKGKFFKDIYKVTNDIKNLIKDVPGLVNLETSADSDRSEIKIIIDRDKIARHGLRISQVAGIIRTAFNGRDVSTYRVGQDEFDIIVRLDKKYRKYDSDLGDLQILTPQGESIVLREVAKISREQAGGTIHHLDLKRIITVEADASKERSGADVLTEVKERLKEYNKTVPAGITINYTGANKVQNEAQAFLVQSFFVAIFLIFLLLVTQFNSFIRPIIILATVIASLAGVVLGMSVHNLPISVLMGGIGTVSLAGIVVNNAIVLIDYIGQLRDKGYDYYDAIVVAGMVRLRPVVLTAVTTILGLLPISVGMDINFYRWPNVVVFGSEGGTFWLPMNLAIIYGLGVATFLTLFLVPVLYLLTEKSKIGLGNLKNRITLRFKKLVTR
ncbi:MAG: efflux RND transporter permease subunit [Deltaproteobacteria bacterium]|jgi:multidrug efflux pump|nr:efflux RND transporter permease subunit [Deltaproteobacteria bacterium]MBT4527169.1 efflux RND transporter permease subunit [Deltaproteobacteria bacterium]